MNQTWENVQKTNFGSDFGLFWPKYGCQSFFRVFYLYQMLYIVESYHCMQFQGKLMNQTWENGKKTNFGPDFSLFLAQIWAANFSPANLASSVTTYHGQLSPCTISEKTNDPILRKLSDGRTDRQTDRRTRLIFHRTLSD